MLLPFHGSIVTRVLESELRGFLNHVVLSSPWMLPVESVSHMLLVSPGPMKSTSRGYKNPLIDSNYLQPAKSVSSTSMLGIRRTSAFVATLTGTRSMAILCFEPGVSSGTRCVVARHIAVESGINISHCTILSIYALRNALRFI